MKDDKLCREVAEIIENVKRNGDSALIYYLKKFDFVDFTPNDFLVSKQEISNSIKKIDPELKNALKKAYKNICKFHQAELKRLPCCWRLKQNSGFVGQIYQPIEKVGIYIPGGRYSYPSTVLMTAIPARIAGAKKIVMVTPPNNLTSSVLYAATLCEVDHIYKIGGPFAIAALAFGTKTIPNVDIIAGPGNAYVNEAKRQLIGHVGIDSLAGPSEIAIIADKTAKANYIAADLLAQAEHDPKAKSYLYTDSKELLLEVQELLPSYQNGQIALINCGLSEAIDSINKLAPEHLEIMVQKPEKIINSIFNAGAIFVGENSPTAVGDYWAGPSHVLPTGGASRFSSGISCTTFLKKISFIKYPINKLPKDKRYIEKIAQAEGLNQHGYSVRIRN